MKESDENLVSSLDLRSFAAARDLPQSGQILSGRKYCTISFSSARGDRLAEIWTSATLRVDRGHARISAKAKIRPPVLTVWCGTGTECLYFVASQGP